MHRCQIFTSIVWAVCGGGGVECGQLSASPMIAIEDSHEGNDKSHIRYRMVLKSKKICVKDAG